MFENREEEEIQSDWFAVLDHAIHQGRLNLDFLSIDTTFHDDPDWESMPHGPNQLLPFIRSFVNGHVWPLIEGERPVSIPKCLCIEIECYSSAADNVRIWYRSIMAGRGLPK
jgi:hypothetical protein|uniref:Uncharacterized protein n=1 Tax=Bionectria ochroleuca TaxID=29856 RepID=A0A8H7NPG3_BIOOC